MSTLEPHRGPSLTFGFEEKGSEAEGRGERKRRTPSPLRTYLTQASGPGGIHPGRESVEGEEGLAWDGV